MKCGILFLKKKKKKCGIQNIGYYLGLFPTKYLGLPLKPGRISQATLQPFLEQITTKLHSWTVQYLSFAGKIKFITSVIYGKVNFWSSVFVLPKSFYAKIDSLCAAFLWKNKTGNARGARVAWSDICKPKKEGGLGIRLLEEFEMVFRLKHVWNFFTNKDSLWIRWLKANVFHRKPFLLMEDSARLSKAVRSMVQIKDMLGDYLRCEVGNGKSAMFWFDSWNDLGPLIEFVGAAGPRQLRLRLTASVVDATADGQWQLPAARSPQVEALQIHLTSLAPPIPTATDDKFLWVQANGTFGSTFSSRVTYESLRNPSPVISWHSVIWFKQYIPRNSFISWLAMLRRLPTRDRLRRWGMSVPEVCVLCSAAPETHHHLFFECSFSSSVWNYFASKVWDNPPQDIHSVAAWINLHRSSSPQARYIIRLMFQSSIYLIWKERNKRIFTTQVTSAFGVRSAVDRQIRDRLLSIKPSPAFQPPLLQFFFACTRPP